MNRNIPGKQGFAFFFAPFPEGARLAAFAGFGPEDGPAFLFLARRCGWGREGEPCGATGGANTGPEIKVHKLIITTQRNSKGITPFPHSKISPQNQIPSKAKGMPGSEEPPGRAGARQWSSAT
jgi:hypothetical protein